MAGDWIQMRHDLSDDPAVIGIAERTKLDEYSVIGRLHRVWTWADRQTLNGNAPSVTVVWLDRYVQCDGFGMAMVCVGWLEVVDTPDFQGLRIPKFDEYISQSAKQRALTARRAKNFRANSNADRNAQSNAGSVTKSAPKEEKRREENNTGRKRPSDGTYSPDFETFWSIYPKIGRVKKPFAWKAWNKAIQRTEPEKIISAVKLYAESETGMSPYAGHASTWLNGDRWTEDADSWSRQSQVSSKIQNRAEDGEAPIKFSDMPLLTAEEREEFYSSRMKR